jgi:DNA-binding transcriptional ArsR family regulator
MAKQSRKATLENSARVFAALGDETRLGLVYRLCEEGPLSITQLTLGINATRQAVTKHLIKMENAGLVQGSWHGRKRIWELDKKRLPIAQLYLSRISKHWDNALNRLRDLVEHSLTH